MVVRLGLPGPTGSPNLPGPSAIDSELSRRDAALQNLAGRGGPAGGCRRTGALIEPTTFETYPSEEERFITQPPARATKMLEPTPQPGSGET